MENSVFFFKQRYKKEVLQEMQWKSFCDAKSIKKDNLLKLVADGTYVSVMSFVPSVMVKGETK